MARYPIAIEITSNWGAVTIQDDGEWALPIRTDDRGVTGTIPFSTLVFDAKKIDFRNQSPDQNKIILRAYVNSEKEALRVLVEKGDVGNVEVISGVNAKVKVDSFLNDSNQPDTATNPAEGVLALY